MLKIRKPGEPVETGLNIYIRPRSLGRPFLQLHWCWPSLEQDRITNYGLWFGLRWPFIRGSVERDFAVSDYFWSKRIDA